MFQVWRSAVELNAPPQWRICAKKLRERENWPFLHEEKRVLGGGGGGGESESKSFLAPLWPGKRY